MTDYKDELDQILNRYQNHKGTWVVAHVEAVKQLDQLVKRKEKEAEQRGIKALFDRYREVQESGNVPVFMLIAANRLEELKQELDRLNTLKGE